MSKTTLTVRVDPELKKEAELASEYLGLTLTAVVHQSMYDVIDRSQRAALLLDTAKRARSSAHPSFYPLSSMPQKERDELILLLGGKIK